MSHANPNCSRVGEIRYVSSPEAMVLLAKVGGEQGIMGYEGSLGMTYKGHIRNGDSGAE